MSIPNPAHALLTAPLGELVVVLLKQFRRLLQEGSIPLTVQDMEAYGQAVENNADLPANAPLLKERLLALIAESETDLLQRFGLTFERALNTDMGGIDGWETTSEFIELANHKSNAELRISASATLLAMFGDATHTAHLWDVINEDKNVWDVDACLAKRALCHLYSVSPSAPDWREQIG